MNLMLYVTFLFLVLSNVSNNQETVDDKYLQAIIYLKVNKDINRKIKKAYPNFTNKKNTFVEFNISNRIEYFPIYHFQSDLRKNNCGVDSIYIEDITSHRKSIHLNLSMMKVLVGLFLQMKENFI